MKINKIKCLLGFHSWVYHYVPHSRGHKEWKTCEKCKIEFFTTDYYNLWHRLFPGMMYYRDPENIIKKGDK